MGLLAWWVPAFDAAEARRTTAKLAAQPITGRSERRLTQRDALGATERTEKAVAAALGWLVRHQSGDGSWSIEAFRTQCKDPSCTGVGNTRAPSAGTALGLLPLMAGGHSPKLRGPYQKPIQAGLQWLVRKQLPSGDLRCGGNMYAHGLATLALAEAYALTSDRSLGQAAQQAVNFIQAAQHPGGGWRYVPGEDGDVSVVGWQVMALVTARWAGLRVEPATLTKATRYLEACAKGKSKGLFGYRPEFSPSACMTAAGLLCSQHLGIARDDPAMVEGVEYLTKQLVEDKTRNFYQWYYGTYALHNVPGKDWQGWISQISTLLVSSQEAARCAAGSWDPLQPTPDPYAEMGGRLYTTSFAALVLQAYYRYPPQYSAVDP